MADSADELFVWGDDFETILDILEDDEEIEEQFTSTVSEVRLICANLGSWCLEKWAEMSFLTPFDSRKQTSLLERDGKEMSYLSFDFLY